MPTTAHSSFGRIASSAALGFAAGLALPHARKALMQAPSIAAGDWVAALSAEHRVVEKLFEKLLKTTDSDRMKREMLLSKISYALSKHAVEEENVVYPALSENGRADAARHLAEEHAHIKTFIYELRRIPAGDMLWLERAGEFWSVLAGHMQEEEQEVFPAFRDALGEAENGKLAAMMNWEGFKVA